MCLHIHVEARGQCCCSIRKCFRSSSYCGRYWHQTWCSLTGLGWLAIYLFLSSQFSGHRHRLPHPTSVSVLGSLTWILMLISRYLTESPSQPLIASVMLLSFLNTQNFSYPQSECFKYICIHFYVSLISQMSSSISLLAMSWSLIARFCPLSWSTPLQIRHAFVLVKEWDVPGSHWISE